MFPGNGTGTDAQTLTYTLAALPVRLVMADFPGKPSNSSPRASEHPRRVAADQHRNFLPSLPESGRDGFFFSWTLCVLTHTTRHPEPGGSSWFPDTRTQGCTHPLPASPSTNTNRRFLLCNRHSRVICCGGRQHKKNHTHTETRT